MWFLAISFTSLFLLCFYISNCQLLSNSIKSNCACPKNFPSDWLLLLVVWLSFPKPYLSSEDISCFYTQLLSPFTEACSCQSYFRFLLWALELPSSWHNLHALGIVLTVVLDNDNRYMYKKNIGIGFAMHAKRDKTAAQELRIFIIERWVSRQVS